MSNRLLDILRRFLAFLISLLLLQPALAQGAGGSSEVAPAAKTQLSEQGKSLKPVMFSPSLGLMTNVSDLARTDQYATVLDNVQMLKRGIWTSRGIGHIANQSTLSMTGDTIINEVYSCQVNNQVSFIPVTLLLSLANLNNTPTATAHILSGTVVEGAGGPPNGAAHATITIDPEKIACFRMFKPEQIVMCHESVQPYIGDWTASFSGGFVESSEWPVTIDGVDYENPKFGEPFASRMAYAGFPDEPNTVVLSAYDDADDFTVSGTPAATDAGAITFRGLGNITGMKRMRLDNTSNTDEVLLVGFDHGFGMITGIDALSFSSVVLTDEFGLLSNRTFAQLGNELFFLATDGIRKFTTSSGLATLSNSCVSFGIKELTQRINKSKAYKSFVVPHASTQELLFWFPSDSSTKCDKAIVLNYNTQAPGAVTNAINPIFSTRSGQEYSCGTTILGPIGGFSVSGAAETTIYGLYIPPGGHASPTAAPWACGYNGDTYNGTNYDWSYVSPLIGANTPSQSCSMRFTEILTDGTNQTFTTDAYLLVQQSNGVTSRKLAYTKDFSITSETVTALETWTSGTTSSYPKFIRFSAPGTGRFWQLRLKGTGGQHIALTGLNAVLTLGGWDQ